jgi:hypothetical protein
LEKIVSAAVRDKKGNVHVLPAPAHHKQITSWLKKDGIAEKDLVKGFWTSEERFVGREQAGRIARRAGQATTLRFDPELHCGDMW